MGRIEELEIEIRRIKTEVHIHDYLILFTKIYVFRMNLRLKN